MDTTLTARPLTNGRYVIGLATQADEAGLRRLLRETPMPGPIQITLEREPDFFAATQQEGGRYYTAAIRDRQTGQLVAMGSRSVRKLFVNGHPRRIGYLSQLRIAPEHRRHSRQFLRMGFDLLRQTHAEDEMPFDITTIVADNEVARRLLEAGLPGLPRYTPVERILTMLLPVRGPASRAPSLPGTTGGAPILQFAPVEIPCSGVWDQRMFKQIVVRGYSPWLRRCRWLWRLPAVGTVLPVAYWSCPSLTNDDLDAARAAAREKGCRWLAFGLSERHSLVDVVRRRYRPRVYKSILYVVHEPDTTVELDGRIAHVEVALL
ncbi:MAG TPA: hypothetical protein VLZ30_07060 [Verrucomicrobiae bacterium]|nr:hypothetical protein [Verrucomicrobiae bacterium]